MNFRIKDDLQFQLGRFVTPHGIINIEHFPAVLLELNQPQFLRPFPGQTIFSNFMTGGQVHCKIFTGEGEKDVLEYNVYAGIHPSDASNFMAGARVGYTFGDSGLTVGGNYGYGHREANPGGLGNLSTVGKGSLTTNDYNLLGLDVLYDKDEILWKSELFYSFEDSEQNRLGFYTQPAYRFNDKWIGFYRFDYLDPGQGVHDSIEHVVGVNYLPVPTVRFRGSYILKQFGVPDADLSVFQLSVTVSF